MRSTLSSLAVVLLAAGPALAGTIFRAGGNIRLVDVKAGWSVSSTADSRDVSLRTLGPSTSALALKPTLEAGYAPLIQEDAVPVPLQERRDEAFPLLQDVAAKKITYDMAFDARNASKNDDLLVVGNDAAGPNRLSRSDKSGKTSRVAAAAALFSTLGTQAFAAGGTHGAASDGPVLYFLAAAVFVVLAALGLTFSGFGRGNGGAPGAQADPKASLSPGQKRRLTKKALRAIPGVVKVEYVHGHFAVYFKTKEDLDSAREKGLLTDPLHEASVGASVYRPAIRIENDMGWMGFPSW